MAKKLKVRLTRCYLVEVVDEKGNVQEYIDVDGTSNVADDYCFGTKEDAMRVGNTMIEWVKESEE